MEKINSLKSGVVFGILLGGWHLLWAALVAAGWAQAVLDFIFWMHLLKPIYLVSEFHLGVALVLIGVTTSLGFVGGFLLAFVWNQIQQ